MWGVWQGEGKSGGGRGDVWDGVGEVRSVGKDVSICEERCGSVEKCCVGGVGKRGKTKKGPHGRRRSFFCAKSREDQKMDLHVSLVIAPFRPYFAFRPQGGDITHFENRCITVGLPVQLHL